MTAGERFRSGAAALPDALAGAVTAADGLLLGLDFDGTLAPLVDDPTAAALAPGVDRTLRRLATRPGVSLAVVSGRALSDLVDRVGLDGVVYAGNHGLELGYDGDVAVHPVAADCREAIDRLCATLADRLADVPGCAVENKGVTATVHFRTTPEESVPTVLAAVERVTDGVGGVRVTEGNCVRELRPAVAWDKGDAMRSLSATAPAGRRPVYVGDDTTDEDAFAALPPGGVGVRVVHEGASVDTAAAVRLDGQPAVPRLLDRLDEAADRFDGGAGWTGVAPLAAPFSTDPA